MQSLLGLITIGLIIYFFGLPPNYSFVIHLTTVILVALHNTSSNHLKTIKPIKLTGLQIDILQGRATNLKLLVLFIFEFATKLFSFGAVVITLILALIWKFILTLF